jgi:hypothetical protein
MLMLIEFPSINQVARISLRTKENECNDKQQGDKWSSKLLPRPYQPSRRTALEVLRSSSGDPFFSLTQCSSKKNGGLVIPFVILTAFPHTPHGGIKVGPRACLNVSHIQG